VLHIYIYDISRLRVKKSVSKECEDLIDVEELDAKISSHPQVLDVGSARPEDSDEDNSGLPRRRRVF